MGALVVSRSVFPFNIGTRGRIGNRIELLPTCIGGASSGNVRKGFAILPNERVEKGNKSWTMKELVLRTDDRRGSLPSVSPELTGEMKGLRYEGSRWRGLVIFAGRFVGKGACAATKIGRANRDSKGCSRSCTESFLEYATKSYLLQAAVLKIICNFAPSKSISGCGLRAQPIQWE